MYKTHTISPEISHIYGTGKITVIMNVNLGRFMPEANNEERELFRRKRGSVDFANLLRKLPGNDVFMKLEKEHPGSDPWIEAQGYNIGVFRKHVAENWFFPTYELRKGVNENLIPPKIKDDKVFRQEWDRWKRIKIRLTRNGFIQIKLSRKFTSEPLHTLNTQLLEVEREEFTTSLTDTMDNSLLNERQIQHNLIWQIAYQVIKLFIEKLEKLEFGKDGTIYLQMPQKEKTTPIRDKYTIIFLKRISRDEKSSVKMPAPDVLKDREIVHCIRSLWDGILLSKPDGSDMRYPTYNRNAVRQLYRENQSTFTDELSLIGTERAVIYCPLSTQEIHLPYRGGDSEKGVRYNDYWKCILRGFEHILVLRNELQMVESYSTQKMTEISDYTYALTTHGISPQEMKDVHDLSQQIANWFKLLVSIRGVLVTPSTFRAGYAIQKFNKLIDVLGIKHIEQHVEENIKELNSFVSHFNDLAIQQNGERLQRFAIVFGFLFAFLGVASFLKDAFELNGDFKIYHIPQAIQKIFCIFWDVKIIAALGIVWICLIAFLWFAYWGIHKIMERYDNSKISRLKR